MSVFLVAAAASPATSFVIDDFSTNQSPLTLTQVGTTSNSVAISTGNRTQSLTVSDYTDPDEVARAVSRIRSGFYSLSTDTFVTASGSLLYSYSGANFTGVTDLKFHFLQLDQDATVSYTLTSANGTRSGSSLVSASNSPFFAIIGSSVTGSFNPAAVTSLSISITGPQSLDYRLDQVEAVPEPATLAVVGLGIAGLVRRRRKA